MQNDDALAEQKTIKRTTNAATATRPELKEPIAKGTRMRKPKAWPILSKQFDKPRVVSQYIDRPRFDLGKNSLVKVFNLEGHE